MDRLAESVVPAAIEDPAAVDAWNEAYVTVESYFLALGMRDRLLLSRLIHRVLDRAGKRVREQQPPAAPTTVAMEEAIRLVADWFSTVVEIRLPENRLAARGRLALLLADLPGRLQHYCLADPPLPAEVVAALRESYLTAGPKYQRRNMAPQPIALNPIMRGATRWWDALNRVPVAKALVVGTSLAALGTVLLLFFWR